MMKSVLLATAAVAVLGTAAMADDFDNNTATLELYRDNVAFSLGTVAGEATSLGVDVAVLPHEVLGATADLTLGAEYGVVTEDLTVSATYGVSKEFNAVTAYGQLEAAYTVASGSTDGVWLATPLVGASYRFNDKLSAFGEVSYSWDATNDWAQQGGLVEVGATYNIQDGLYVRPSVTRSFDTAADETNVAIKLGMAF
jgi:opacity protein-like surface antigen